VDTCGAIKVSLSIDWFSAHKGRYSGYHSSGAVLLRIDNIPQNMVSVERRCTGIYVVGLIPGPHEPKITELTAYLKLVTDELKKLSIDGVSIKTARYPEGEYNMRPDQTPRVRKNTDKEVHDVAMADGNYE